jgi:hypothetical protein
MGDRFRPLTASLKSRVSGGRNMVSFKFAISVVPLSAQPLNSPSPYAIATLGDDSLKFGERDGT